MKLNKIEWFSSVYLSDKISLDDTYMINYCMCIYFHTYGTLSKMYNYYLIVYDTDIIYLTTKFIMKRKKKQRKNELL